MRNMCSTTVRPVRPVPFRAPLALGLSLLLAACGGGGGGGGDSTVPAPAPAPPPGIPVPVSTLIPQTNILSTEYYNSNYLSRINAYGAYLLGATGGGVNVAILDGGIDDTGHELSGQVIRHIDATDSNPGGAVPDHGTAVASIVAAARDDSGVEGVAYNAGLYDINVFRPGGAGPTAADSDIARGLEIVAGKDATYTGVNARIVNMSLGGTSPFSAPVIQGLRDLAAADKVVVIAAGNDGGANPEATARAAADPTLNGQMIIVGAVDGTDTIASFSNRAGSYANYFVVAPGVSDVAATTGGGYVYFSGTSASTPVVSGALAVLAEAYPYLSASDLVKLVEQTAADLGDPGIDAIYGWGRVDLQNAMSPVAPLSVPTGATVTAALAPAGASYFVTGGALGAPKGGEIILLDAFHRAYTVPLDALGGPAAHAGLLDRISGLDGAVATPGIGSLLAHWYPAAGSTVTFSAGTPSTGMGRGAAMAFGENTFGVAFRNTRPAALTATEGLEPATGAGHSLFLVTQDAPMPESAFTGRNLDAVAYGVRTPDYAATIGFGQSRVRDGVTNNLFSASLAIAGRSYRAAIVTSLLDQEGGVLGSYGDGAFHDVHGRTAFATLSAGMPLGRWSIDAAYTHATLDEGALGQGLDLGKVEADAMALTLSGPLHVRDGDFVGLRLAQPLRASSARIDAFLPVARTYDGEILRAHQTVDVSPAGRELDLEAAYTTPLPELAFGRKADLRINAYIARQAGNDRSAAIEQGVAASLVISW